VFNHVFNINLN
jgi:hypothetical protein